MDIAQRCVRVTLLSPGSGDILVIGGAAESGARSTLYRVRQHGDGAPHRRSEREMAAVTTAASIHPSRRAFYLIHSTSSRVRPPHFLLVFGEAIDDFPDSRILQVLLFIIPVLGFTLILESVLEFSLTLRDRRRFDRSWCVMLANSYRNHVILIGLGKLGYRTFRTLHQLGEPLVVIERDAANPFAEEVRQAGVPLLTGDARRDATLREANVEHAASVITATSDDLANLEVALDARRINPNVRIVLRVFDQNMADKIRSGFGIGVAMSQSALSAPTFATSALAPSTVSSMVLDGELLSIQRWTVTAGDAVDGVRIADLHRTRRLGVLRLLRDEQPQLMPDPDTTLRPGDQLLLQGTMPDLRALCGTVG